MSDDERLWRGVKLLNEGAGQAVTTRLVKQIPRVSFRRRRGRRSIPTTFALIWLCVVVFATIFGPLVAPYPLNFGDLVNANQGPSWHHLFGTNGIGQDMFSMALYGTRFTILIASGATLISFFIGALIGFTSGMAKGWVDQVLMRFTDFMFAFPGFFFSLILVVVLGRNIFVMTIAIGVVQWAGYARLIRGLVLTVRDSDLIVSGRAVGASTAYISIRYVLPGIVQQILVYAAFSLGNMMNQEVMITLMGFGPPPPFLSLGSMMSSAIPDVLGYRYLLYCPLAVFVLTMVSLIVVADGFQAGKNIRRGGK